jgi:type IV pilus assembly protein PilC
MVRSGEVSGKLSEVFSYLADYLEREYHFSMKIMGALIYPAFVFFVFLLVGGAMIFFIMPQITQLITQTGVKAPLITQILFEVSSFLKKWGWILILLFLSLVIFIIFYLRTREGKIFFDKNLLKIPLLNSFLRKTYLSRLALNLSTLISGGLPIVQSLEITAEVVGNEVYKKIILETAEGVKRGEQISALLERYPREIPPLFIQMVAVGEKTGRLDSALTNIVDFYQKEVERGLDNFMRLLEPILIIVFGLLVGGLMAAVILPLYQIISGF